MKTLGCLGAVGILGVVVGCGGSSPEWSYPPTPTFQSNVGQAPAQGQPTDPAAPPAAPMAPAQDPATAAAPAMGTTPATSAPATAPAASAVPESAKLCNGMGEHATITAKEVPGGLVLEVVALRKEVQPDLDKAVAEFEKSLKAAKAGTPDEAAAKSCPLLGIKQDGNVVYTQKDGKNLKIIVQPKLQKDLPAVTEKGVKVATEPFVPAEKKATPAAPATTTPASTAPKAPTGSSTPATPPAAPKPPTGSAPPAAPKPPATTTPAAPK